VSGSERTYSVAAFARELKRHLNPLGIRVTVSAGAEHGVVVETWRVDRRYARTPFTLPTQRLSPLVAALTARTIQRYYARRHRRRP
jgi:hypothetical protein